MTQAQINKQLLRQYKENGWLTTKRIVSGLYRVTIQDYVFSIEHSSNRQLAGNDWAIYHEEGSKGYDGFDNYVNHSESLTDAQIYLVTEFYEADKIS